LTTENLRKNGADAPNSIAEYAHGTQAGKEEQQMDAAAE
jgi:hypothetical protein